MSDDLAKAYNRALGLEKAGASEAAAAAYGDVLKIDPEDRTGAAVRLAAMGFGAVPAKAPNAYVSLLFDQTAEAFDDILVEQLGYSVPLIVRDWLTKAAPGPYRRMLDLGCGTGLCGEALHDMTVHRTGVDLSENMLGVADEKEVYDDLYVGEVAEFLAASSDDDQPDDWDLIVAADVLPYIGAIDDLFAGIAARLVPGGVVAFSNETQSEEMMRNHDYMVGPFHRFAHTERYIRDRLSAHGLAIQIVAEITIRYEQGQPVPGHLVLARHVESDNHRHER